MRKIPQKRVLNSFLLVFVMLSTLLFSLAVFAAKPDRIAPSAPTNLSAVSVADTSASLAWSKSTDNVGVSSYYIYKDSVYIGNTISLSFTVSGLTPAKSYKFFVRARDAAGNLSTASNTISVTTANSTAPAPVPVTAAKKVVGYYAAWAAYSGFTPDKLDAGKLTHVNYAFANIGSDLKITLGYPDVDPSNISKLNALKQINPNLKTIISVGGWSWSGRFSDAALSDTSRTAFADSCVSFIVKYGFDGVDIDWEYPVSGGMATNTRRPEDKQNFTLLLKKIRERLDARGLTDNKHYLLTMAGASGNWYVNNTDLGVLHQYLDFANIMTYDIHGTWDRYTDFNSPLYNNTDASPQYKWSVDSSVDAWLNAGFPAEKLILGIPFYGYRYDAVTNMNNGLYQTYSGGASISYANIASNYLNKTGFTRYYHQQSMVPWLYNGSTFITYDDPQSIGAKTQYIKSKNLGGGAVWELSQDPNRVLLAPLYSGLQ
jgi:chitinase